MAKQTHIFKCYICEENTTKVIEVTPYFDFYTVSPKCPECNVRTYHIGRDTREAAEEYYKETLNNYLFWFVVVIVGTILIGIRLALERL